jgi:hypothetical protein
MADTESFPAIKQVMHNDGNAYGFTAGADILAGQVVAYAAAGVTMTVIPAVAGTTAEPIGVAIIPAAKDAPVAVALVGSIVTVCEGAGTAIDAGDPVADDDNALGGCVKTAVTTATGYRIGIALEDIAANGTGKILVQPQIITKAAT